MLHSWAHVISALEKYLSLAEDWPVSSPLGRLNEGGCDDVRRGTTGALEWLIDMGVHLERIPRDERDVVLVVARIRRAEHAAVAHARNDDMAARRSGAVQDVRDKHQRSRREWRKIADGHQRERRRLERWNAYKHGMDHLSVLVVKLA